MTIWPSQVGHAGKAFGLLRDANSSGKWVGEFARASNNKIGGKGSLEGKVRGSSSPDVRL